MADRLKSLGGELAETVSVAHDTAPVAAAITTLRAKGLDPIIVFAASAIVDRNDVIPAAVVAAGGEVTHLGMPVDPGNLMMMGRIGDSDVIGAPSCAGSPSSTASTGFSNGEWRACLPAAPRSRGWASAVC